MLCVLKLIPLIYMSVNPCSVYVRNFSFFFLEIFMLIKNTHSDKRTHVINDIIFLRSSFEDEKHLGKPILPSKDSKQSLFKVIKVYRTIFG